MKGFVTKYALTTGISEVSDNFYKNGDNYLKDRTTGFAQLYSKSAKQWHETREEAIEQAYKMKFGKAD